jgi:hypothetical protein
MASRSCLLTLLDDGWLRVEFTYSAEAVEALKRSIPHQDREWHELGRYWRVKGTHEAWLLTFAKSYPIAEYQRGHVTQDLHSGRRREPLDLCGGANDA